MATFYATVAIDRVRKFMPGEVAYLLPASSWARRLRKDGSLPPVKLPPHVTALAADCGGFVATLKWGEYRYSPAQYVAWLHTFPEGKLQWAATMDYCCEDEITSGNSGIVVERQWRTTLNAWMFWDEYKDSPWAWVPTIQGWHVEDYIRHAQEMKTLIYQMRDHYQQIGNPHFRVGIGTLCARASTRMINQVVQAVSRELPGIQFHLWGVKLSYLKSTHALLGCISSFDSAAFYAGGISGGGLDAKYEAEAMGMTQRQYVFGVALPRYVEKVNTAIQGPKQLPLAI